MDLVRELGKSFFFEKIYNSLIFLTKLFFWKIGFETIDFPNKIFQK